MQVNNIFTVNFIFCPLKTNTWRLKNIACNRNEPKQCSPSSRIAGNNPRLLIFLMLKAPASTTTLWLIVAVGWSLIRIYLTNAMVESIFKSLFELYVWKCTWKCEISLQTLIMFSVSGGRKSNIPVSIRYLTAENWCFFRASEIRWVCARSFCTKFSFNSAEGLLRLLL